MKKLLLVLFISFGLIGSANANSIKGAFGVKLGQVVNNVKIEKDYEINGSLWRVGASMKFVPKKPLPGNLSYWVRTTLKNKKVYSISAHYTSKISIDNLDFCSYYGYEAQIMDIFEGKYGEFKDISPTWDGETSNHKYEYVDGSRRIELKVAVVSSY